MRVEESWLALPIDADDDGSNASGDELYVYFQSKISTDRLEEILDTVVDIADPKEPKQPARAEGRVEYRHVSYRYKLGSGDPVLDDISFTAERGRLSGFWAKQAPANQLL